MTWLGEDDKAALGCKRLVDDIDEEAECVGCDGAKVFVLTVVTCGANEDAMEETDAGDVAKGDDDIGTVETDLTDRRAGVLPRTRPERWLVNDIRNTVEESQWNQKNIIGDLYQTWSHKG